MIKGDKEKAIQYANVAIDIDTAKVSKKIKSDPIFIPILARISIPFNIEETENTKTKLEPKEIKAKEHLEEMFELTRNLSYADIKMLKKNYGTKNKEIENQNENQREL